MKKKRYVDLSVVGLFLLSTLLIFMAYQSVSQQKLDKELVRAVERNDVLTVRHLLHRGANPNTPIYPQDKRSAWARWFANLKRDPSLQPLSHTSLLLKAIHQSPDLFNVEQSYYVYRHGMPDNSNLVKALLEAGADVNIRDDHDETPLLVATYLNKSKSIRLLLEHGADPNARNGKGETALVLAAHYADAEIVKELIQRKANVNLVAKDGTGPLEAALCPYGIKPFVPEQTRKTIAYLLLHGASAQNRDTVSIILQYPEFHDQQIIWLLKYTDKKQSH